MSNYNSLKTTIDANIKQNGRQEITGQILNSVLNQMVDILGTGYQFAGVATKDTNPGTTDAKVFYIANGKGTYTNFGGINVTEDDVVVLYWDTAWHKEATGIASQEKLTELVGIYGENINDDNWLKVITDVNGAFIIGIKKNGEIEWSKGIPAPIREYIQNILEGESGSLIDGVNKVYAFLAGYSTADTLNVLLDEKVDKEEGESLIDKDFSDNIYFAPDDNNVYVLTDSIGRLISKIKKDGTFYIEKLESPIIEELKNQINGTNDLLTEVPITLSNNFLDKNYVEIEDTQSIHALISNVEPKAIYMFMVPSTLNASFACKPSLYESNIMYFTSSSFSVRSNNNIAFNLHDYECTTPVTPETIELGTFEYGSFNGSGNNVPNAAAVRSDKIYNAPHGILKVTFDDSRYYAVVNTSSRAIGTKNIIINTSGEEIKSFGTFIRVSLRYKNDTPLADQALIDAANNGAITIQRIYAPSRNLSVSNLTQEELSYIKVYKFIPKIADRVLVAANDSNANDKAKADIVLDGITDTRFLQSLISSFCDINILLCDGNYYLNEIHYIKRSNQYACLSTFDEDGLKHRCISISGMYENRRNQVIIHVSDECINNFSNNNENAIFLVPRLYPVNQSKLDTGYTITGVTIKYLDLYGEFYTKAITGFDTISAASARYKGVNVSGFKEWNSQTFPTMPVGSVGIRTGRGSNNGTSNYIKNCTTIHVERGFSICGEHYIIEDCLAHHCKWGFAFHDKPVGIGVEHPNVMIGCSIEGCYQLMLLTRQGAMSQEEYNAMDHNKGINTLICIGLSTEKAWGVPIDERTNPDVEERETTLGIWEVIPGRYRGRIEGDEVTVMEGSCPNMVITSY